MLMTTHRLSDRGRRGGIAVLTAVTLTAILLIGAVTIDGGGTMSTRRTAQNAADAAALAGTIELAQDLANGTTVTATLLRNAARKVAVDNGFTDDNGVTTSVTVNWPPTTGNWVTNTNSVEVIITCKYNNLLIAGSSQIQVRAVATCDATATGLGNAIIVTDPSGADAFWDYYGNFTMDGTASVMVNSTNANAAFINTTGKVSATVHDVGGSSGGTFTPAVKGNYTPDPDPFALLPAPSTTGLTARTVPAAVNGTITLQPGLYTDLQISSGNAVFQPGLYYVNGGNLWINTTGTVTGNGVTFYYTYPGGLSDTDANTHVGGVKICVTDNNYTFTAPTSGTYAGVSLMQDPNTQVRAFIDFWGIGQMNFGAMYFPGNMLRVWSENNYNGQTNPININANLLVAKDFKVTGPHDWYGNAYNNGWSDVRWHPNLSASSAAKPIVLVE